MTLTAGPRLPAVDEYDEATAIMPALESSKDLPREKEFLALDEDGEALPKDWYLRICGLAQEALSNGMVISETLPKEVLRRRTATFLAERAKVEL